MKKIMKRAFSVLLAFAIAFGALQLVDVELAPKAAAEQVSGFYTYVVEDGEATIIDVNEKISGNAVIPSKLGGYPVTRIDSWAFGECSKLTGISIPDSVTSIGNDAFNGSGYYNKESNWENGVLYIGKYLIDAKETLSGKYEIKSGTKVIATGAFTETKLTSVTIPNSVTSISDNAFYYCQHLESITFPNNIISIGNYAFSYCESLKTIIIPESVTEIGCEAFRNCESMESITIPKNVTNIGSGMFTECGSLTSIIVSADNKVYDSRDNCNAIIETATNSLISSCKTTSIPSSVTNIGYCAFSGCSGLTSITIPGNVESIDYFAFSGCDDLTSVTLLNGVKSIGDDAFIGCNLTSITIPDSVTYIGDAAFMSCSSLTNLTIPGSVADIGFRAFANCIALKTLTVKNGVKNIGEGAFKECYSLTSVTIPDSVETIGAGVFASCDGLTTIKVSSGNKTFDSRNGCNAIIETKTNTLVSGCVSTVIPNTVKTIGEYAFAGLGDIKSIILPDSVTKIGAWAFSDCIGLESINIPNKTTTICEGAFYDCSALKEIKLPDTMNYLDSCAFYYGFALETVDLGNSPDLTLGYNVFDYCNNIKKFIVGKDVENYSTDANGILYNKDKTGLIKYTAGADRSTYTVNSNTVFIEEHAFEDAENLKSIVIPSGLMSVNSAAFIDCDNLTDVYFLGTKSEWNEVYIDDYGNDALGTAKIHFGGKIGDLDNDGQINSSDALAVLRYAVGDIKLTDAQRVFADVNCDGSINSQDALHILRYAVGELTSFD